MAEGISLSHEALFADIRTFCWNMTAEVVPFSLRPTIARN